jgi:ABC-2 type transport system permease protein
MTRERERGTMEALLATPVRPLEVMLGKIAPYILIGYVQVLVILVAAAALFRVPMLGSLVLLSGFMFPYRGMPVWAQWLGEALPLTHFLRVVRGILLKGNGVAEVAPQVWPLAAILVVVSAAALARYQRTLD